MAANNCYRAPRHIERLCQKTNQLFIGRSSNRRRGDPDPQRAIVFPNYFAARGTRHYLNLENNLIFANGLNNHCVTVHTKKLS